MTPEEKYRKGQEDLVTYSDEQGQQNEARKGRHVLSPLESENVKKSAAYAQQNLFAPFHYGGGWGAAQEGIADAATRQRMADERGYLTADSAQLDQGRANELALRDAQQAGNNYYANLAMGSGPSVANAMQRSAIDSNISNTAFQAGQGRGAAGVASSQRMAMMGASPQMLGAVQNAAGQRMGEQLAGMGGFQAGANALSHGDLSRASLASRWATDNAKATLQQRGMNLADSQYYAGLGNQVNQAQQSGQIEGILAQHQAERNADEARRRRKDAEAAMYGNLLGTMATIGGGVIGGPAGAAAVGGATKAATSTVRSK